MNKVGIIGLGNIAKYYKEALKESLDFKLVAVCDINTSAPSVDFFGEYEFFNDYKQMLEVLNLDFVIICTPPATHFEIALYALNNNVSVLVEKPAVLDMSSFDILIETAEKNDLVFDVVLHWQTGEEVLGFNKTFNSSKIEGIKVFINDNYSIDGKSISPEKICLYGAWLDSGVNALSMINTWLNFDDVVFVKKDFITCETSGLPIMCDVLFEIGGVPVQIKVDWRNNNKDKYSEVIYNGEKMLISSTNQSIIYQDKIYDFAKGNRLQAHYTNFFRRYSVKSNVYTARKIHEILFKIKDI